MKVLQLRQDRIRLNAEARKLLTGAETEKRDMSPEENEKFDQLMKKVDELDGKIEAASADENEDEDRDDEEGDNGPTPQERLAAAEQKAQDDAQRSLQKRNHQNRINPETDGRDFRASKKYAEAFRHWVRTGREHRDLALGTTSAGGYLVTPTKLSNDIIVALNNLVFMRKLASVETLTEAASLGVPQITTDVSDADWTAEVPTDDVAADSALATGRRDLNPQFLCKLVLISHKLLQFSSRVEGVVDQRLSYKFGVAEENGFLNGTGSGQPLGVFVADANGIPTTQDTVCASQTVFTVDELIDCAYSLPQQYSKSPSFGWIMHRLTVAKCRKFKNGDGTYVWQPGLALDRPDTLLGFPVYQSEYAPKTYTTGKYVAVLGDYKYYQIADVANMEIQRLVERFATKNQVGFLGRRYVDGAPVLAKAFARLKLG